MLVKIVMGYVPPQNGKPSRIKEAYLHSDAIPEIPGADPKVVIRASDVEFDHKAQQWVATTTDGKEIGRDGKRCNVLAQERTVIENSGALERALNS